MYAQPTLNGAPSAPSSYSNPNTFGATSVRIIPVPATYQSGYLPGQGFPAENENYLAYNTTLSINAIANDISNIHAEILSVLTDQGITPNGTTIQLKTAINSKVIDSFNHLVPIQPLTNPITTNTTYTIPSNVKSATILIPATLLKAGTGGPWLLTITAGLGGTNIIVPISASGDTISSDDLLFDISVDVSGNVSSKAWTISGSNANGTYVKSSDGTMEQTGFATHIGAVGGVQYNDQHPFAVSFTALPIVAVTHSPVNNTVQPIFTGGYAQDASNWVTYFKVTTGQDMSSQVIAIGRWK